VCEGGDADVELETRMVSSFDLGAECAFARTSATPGLHLLLVTFVEVVELHLGGVATIRQRRLLLILGMHLVCVVVAAEWPRTRTILRRLA